MAGLDTIPVIIKDVGDEAAIANFIVKELKAVGVKSSQISYDSANKKSPIGGQIGNLIVKLPGSIKGPRRLLMAAVAPSEHVEPTSTQQPPAGR